MKPAREALPPPGTITSILPEVPTPTTAVMLVVETTAKEYAAVPPSFTEEDPVKFVPVMVIVSPKVAVVGVNEVMVGAGQPLFFSTETLLELLFATVKSGLPSPFKSSIEML